MRFARWVFRIAGVYGVLVLLPQYFLEGRIGRDQPPPIAHPEYFYGFVGVALAWQVLFLVLSSDPVRYRPLMPVTVLAKLTFGVAVPVLYALGRVAPMVVAFAAVDLVLGVLFAVAYAMTPRIEPTGQVTQGPRPSGGHDG